MKKIFYLLTVLLFASNAMAGSYTIIFKEGNSTTSDSSNKVTTIETIISDGASYVSAVSATNVYNARQGRGIKLGTSSNTGSLELTLAAPVKATSIVVNARSYNDTEGTLFIQDKNDYELTTTFADYTYTYTQATEISKITLGSVTKRNYIVSVTVNFEGEAGDPSLLFEGEHAVAWDTPLDFAAAKFANAKAGNKIVVTYKGASDGIEFKVLNSEFNHLAGSREAMFLDSGDGVHTLEQFLTPNAVDSIKAHGLQLIGNHFTVTKVQLLEGKELKEKATVWTGFFWADEWTTLELYRDGYKDYDLSKYSAIRFYTEAGSPDYVLNFLSEWGDGGKIADQSTMTNGEGYKELALTDELRTKMAAASHWLIQFNKEAGEPFNVTDVVLVKAGPANCAEAAEAALSVSKNNELYEGGKEFTIEGYVTAIQTAFSATNKNITFWMADTENGGKVLEAYRAACATAEDAPNVGDKVAVTGKLTKYNTTPEFAAGCTFVIKEKSAAPVNLGAKTIGEFLELKNVKDTCELTGVVTKIENSIYGNLYLAEGKDTVYVYGVLNAAGETKKFESLNVAEKDTLTIKAVYSEYNGQPQVTNAIFVKVKKYEQPDGIETITVNRKSGKAVKVFNNGQLLIIKDGKTYSAQGMILK